MEYEAMLKQPELLSGLGDLLEDPDPVVIKRLIRVFANVYRHAISKLASGDFDEATFNLAWPSVRRVAAQLMNMLAVAENEGIIIHIVRFLEASLVAHLVSDLSTYPDINFEGMSLVSKGIECLTKLITTPYVGGSSFIVATRAIITVACYKPDIREEVITLIEKQIGSPPPTLFDHNVRSLNKILQRNLFRILRRVNSLPLRGRLVEMMVTVGVPRRMLSQWAPPQESRKRVAPMPNNDDIVSGRNSPPTKKLRHENSSDDEGRATPTDPRESKVSKDPREVKDPRLAKLSQEREIVDESRDSRGSSLARESAEVKRSKSESPPLPPPPLSPPPKPSTPPQEVTAKEEQLLADKPPSGRNTPSSGRSTPKANLENTVKNTQSSVNSNFEFLKNLITSTKESTSAKPFLQKCSEKERALYERLDHPRVVEVVLFCLETKPDSHPDDLLSQLGYSGDDVNGIREHLTKTLAPHITEEFINSLTPPHESSSLPVTNPANLSRPSSTSSASTTFSSRSSPPPSHLRESSPPSPPSSNRSTPTDPNQVCISDTDLRKYLDRGFSSSKDVDMRTAEPRAPSERDPRTAKVGSSSSRNSPVDPRLASASAKFPADPRVTRDFSQPPVTEQGVTVSQSSVMDPRITMNDPRTSIPHGNDQRNVMNPGLRQPFADIRDPRVGIPPPSHIISSDMNFNTNQNFGNMGIDPRMAMRGGPFDSNFGNKFGMHCGINYQDPRLGNAMGNFGKGLMGSAPPPPPNVNNRMGPMNMNDPRFVGRPGLFGPPPGPMNNGPWQNMPMRSSGPGIFPRTPPMHL